jgi:hypothetical protein
MLPIMQQIPQLSQQVPQIQPVTSRVIETIAPTEGATRSNDSLRRDTEPGADISAAARGAIEETRFRDLIDAVVDIEARATKRYQAEKAFLSSLCRLLEKKSRKRVLKLAPIVKAYNNTNDFHEVIIEINSLDKEREQDFANLKLKLTACEDKLMGSVTAICDLIKDTPFDYDSAIDTLSYWIRRLDASALWIEKRITALAAVDNTERRAVANCFANLRGRESERQRAERLARRAAARPIEVFLPTPQVEAEAEAQRITREAAAKAELARLAGERFRERCQKAEAERQRYLPRPRSAFATKAERREARQRERVERAHNRVEVLP